MNIPFQPKQGIQQETARPKRFFDEIRDHLRFRHYSYSTEKTYLFWIKSYILFHNKKHPKEMGASEIKQFLTDLAVKKHVSSSTQNQAFNALIYLYREVLRRNPGTLEGIPRAKGPKRIPTVLTRSEVQRILSAMAGTSRLFCALLYGSGLLSCRLILSDACQKLSDGYIASEFLFKENVREGKLNILRL
jgi:site-specific recombinase XerD